MDGVNLNGWNFVPTAALLLSNPPAPRALPLARSDFWRADGTLARFQKRHNLDITATLIALHGVGVGGYDRVRRRDVYHCEAARL
jgi:hypothetical protein